MRPFLRPFWALCLLSIPAYPQATATLTVGQVGYFVSFFDRIGSADINPVIVGNNEMTVERIFDMNPAESATLHSAAQTFRGTMAELRQSENSIVAGKLVLTDADRSSLAQLVQRRDQSVSSLAVSPPRGHPPETAARLLADAQATIKLRAAKGVQVQ